MGANTPLPYLVSLDLLFQDLGLLPSTSEPFKTFLHKRPFVKTSQFTSSNILNFKSANFFLSLLKQPRQNNNNHDEEELVDGMLEELASLALHPVATMAIGRRFSNLIMGIGAKWLKSIGFKDGGFEIIRGGGAEKNDDNLEKMDIDSEGSDTDMIDNEQMRARAEGIWHAFGRLLGIFPQLYPLFMIFLRHPLLTTPVGPVRLFPGSTSTSPHFNPLTSPSLEYHLLTFHRILTSLPNLSRSPFLTQTSKNSNSNDSLSPSWPLPDYILTAMKTHPSRGVRLIACRCARIWFGMVFHAEKGEELIKKWVWDPNDGEENDGNRNGWMDDKDKDKDFESMEACPFPCEEDGVKGNDGGGETNSEDFLEWEYDLEGTKAERQEGGKKIQIVGRRWLVDVWTLSIAEMDRIECCRREVKECEAEIKKKISEARGQTQTRNDIDIDVRRILLEEDFVSVFSSSSDMVVNLEGKLVMRESIFAKSPSSSSSQMNLSSTSTSKFCPIAPARTATRQIADCLSFRRPVLLSSHPSSGKHTVLDHLANILGAPLPVRVNLADRSLDGKSLIGNYASSSSKSGGDGDGDGGGDSLVGIFEFVEGSLTRAIREGRWIILEDIDKAGEGVLAVIKELADRIVYSIGIDLEAEKKLGKHEFDAGWCVGGGWGGAGDCGGIGVWTGSGGTGKWVPAAQGFMLFATQSVAPKSSSSLSKKGAVIGESSKSAMAKGRNFYGKEYWKEIWLDTPSTEDLVQIVKTRMLGISAVPAGLPEKLVKIWNEVSDTLEKAKNLGGSFGSRRSVGIEELTRWSARIANHLSRHPPLDSIESNPVIQEEIFLEAHDIFAGSFPSSSIVSRSHAVIAQGLSIGEERLRWILEKRVPEIVLPKEDDGFGKPLKAKGAHNVKIGRSSLVRERSSGFSSSTELSSSSSKQPYAFTKPSLVLLERLSVSLLQAEPVLMVGETGTGKTAATSKLAELAGRKLVSLNLSTQTEAADLLGGYKPVEEAEVAKEVAVRLFNQFIDLFQRTFSLSKNPEFVSAAQKAFEKNRYPRLLALWRQATKMAATKFNKTLPRSPTDEGIESPRKRRKLEPPAAGDDRNELSEWNAFANEVDAFDSHHIRNPGKTRLQFAFVEGPLVTALREGHWLLLDEINLASSETLEALSSILHSPSSSLVLTERGDIDPIPRHPDFRLFACMNPATDVGKRDLPSSLRRKFTEFWVSPPDADKESLLKIVEGYIAKAAVGDKRVVLDTADLYISLRAASISAQFSDRTNQPPHFSMRTLARALGFAAELSTSYNLRRALFEAFLMAFTMSLDDKSLQLANALIDKHILLPAKNSKSALQQRSARPSKASGHDYVPVGPFWLETGDAQPEQLSSYILTPSVQTKLCDLARLVAARRFPVLIQGPTSTGKTSIIEYLAHLTGHHFVRINNHEHTDLQEYVGTYLSDPQTGKFVFKEGLLVSAMRRGHWLVLDELNLAPTDVLEALNRLLDDNRELLIPETQELVKPHPHFMLFATQNPPGSYGGRKVLSRAFRNRFLEVHYDDVPQGELEVILSKRCCIAESHARRIINVFVKLQQRRQATRVFEQRQSFATLRDLFRWAGRDATTIQELAEQGYMLLGERTRQFADAAIVKEAIEEVFKVRLDPNSLYRISKLPEEKSLTWTEPMLRMWRLVNEALERNEPVLLVGETGLGKTSLCQAIASALGRRLRVINCHQNTEAGDLLGSQRPRRNREMEDANLLSEVRSLLAHILPHSPPPQDLNACRTCLDSVSKRHLNPQKQARLTELVTRVSHASALFEWRDGPLVDAMKRGDLCLLDEISLADDSVLERLNSVLEPSRSLTLAERGGDDPDAIQVTAAPPFGLLATMNPGGDYGKKELSAALRNRFTEIWVPPLRERKDILEVLVSRASHPEIESYCHKILDFEEFLRHELYGSGESERSVLGLRDMLSWIDFINVTFAAMGKLSFLHGAMMVFIDGLGNGSSVGHIRDFSSLRTRCKEKAAKLVSLSSFNLVEPLVIKELSESVSISEFSVTKGDTKKICLEYVIDAPATVANAMRVFRALQLTKPILLEGSPGVGKSSLIMALAALTDHALCRVNLSDQTDLADLFGGDLPDENGGFSWRNAPFLTAMLEGQWVLLDEMNLASQPVLEGLNSCLDHRGSVYVPELDRTFERHPNFRIFATQNPMGQGGGRKGLPKSFLNRFSVVHMEELSPEDMFLMCRSTFPAFDNQLLRTMIDFNAQLHNKIMKEKSFGHVGSPWEFNLRDVLRWVYLVNTVPLLEGISKPQDFLDPLFVQRLRTSSDRHAIRELSSSIFGASPTIAPPTINYGSNHIKVGHGLLPRDIGAPFARYFPVAPIQKHDRVQATQAILDALQAGWLTILEGSSDNLRTDLIRSLAALKGNELRELTLSSESDTLELLGTFEQYSGGDELQSLVTDLTTALQNCLAQSPLEPILSDCYSRLSFIRMALDNADIQSAIYDHLVPLSEALATFMPQFEFAKRLAELPDMSSLKGSFRWLDGPLVEAMKRGEWLLIHNANRCSQAVLDRLNGLFEPGGSLQLNERGNLEGAVPVVHPHPNFRVIMSFDPASGELSRAMRNRGIEIDLLQEFSNDSLTEEAFPTSCLLSDLVQKNCFELLRRLLSPSRPLTQELLQARKQHFLSGLSPLCFGLASRQYRQCADFDWIHKVPSLLRSVKSHTMARHIYRTRHTIASSKVSFNILQHQPLDILMTFPFLCRDSETTLRYREFYYYSSALPILVSVLSSSHQLTEATSFERGGSSCHPNGLDNPRQLASKEQLAQLGSVMSASFEAVFVLDFSHQADFLVCAHPFLFTVNTLREEIQRLLENPSFDYSTTQVTLEWILEALANTPKPLTTSFVSSLKIANSLKIATNLTSGKFMANIWQCFNEVLLQDPEVISAFKPLVDSLARVAPSCLPAELLSFAIEILPRLKTGSVGNLPHIVGIIESLRKEIDSQTSPTLSEELSSDHMNETRLALKFQLPMLLNNGGAIIYEQFVGSSECLPLRLLFHSFHRASSSPSAFVESFSEWARACCDGFWPVKIEPTAPRDLLQPKLLEITLIHLNESSSVEIHNFAKQRARTTRILDTRRLLANGCMKTSQSLTSSLCHLLLTLADMSTSQAENLHPNILPPDLPSLVTRTLEVCARIPHLELRHLYKEICFPALRRLATVSGSSLPSLELGHFCASVGRLLWRLFVPDVPLDPLVRLNARREYLLRIQKQLVAQLAVEDQNTHLTGGLFSPRSQIIQENLDRVQSEIDTQVNFNSPRSSDPTLLDSLFNELTSLEQHTLREGRLEKLVEAIRSNPTQLLANETENICATIRMARRRMSQTYDLFSDLLKPIDLSLSLHAIGASFLAHAATSGKATRRSEVIQTISKFPFVASTVEIPTLMSLKSFPERFGPSIASLSLLSLASLPSPLRLSHSMTWIRNIYDRIYTKWAQERDKAEEEKLRQQRLYKFHENDSGEENETETALFPTYEDGEELSSEPGRQLLSHKEDLWLAHLRVFNMALEQTESSLLHLQFIARKHSLIQELMSSDRTVDGEKIDETSFAWQIETLARATSLNHGVDIERDFYKDENPMQVEKVEPTIKRLSGRLRVILAEFPEQMVLQNLLTRCEEILNLPINVPVARVLAASERLLLDIEDWEPFADRAHSLKENQSDLTILIVHWRQLELSSWDQLLRVEYRNFQESLNEWIFRFYETVILTTENATLPDPSSRSLLLQIGDLVGNFMVGSPVGQFANRLRLLQSFAHFTRRISVQHPLQEALEEASNVLNHTSDFYGQYAEAVRAFFLRSEAELIKEIKNTIKLASWKDVNVHALRESAKRSHKQLHRLVRKYRELLRSPAQSHFLPRVNTEESTHPALLVNKTPAPSVNLPQMTSVSFAQIGKPHHVDLDRTWARFSELSTSKLSCVVKSDAGDAFDQFSTMVIQTAEELRNESIPQSSNEEQAKIVRNLTRRKRKAWADLLKEIKRIGISSRPSPHLLERNSDKSFAFQKPPIEREYISVDFKTVAARSDAYYYHLLSRLPTIRQSLATEQLDLPRRDLERAIGHFESCMGFISDDRDQLTLLSGCTSQMIHYNDYLHKLTESPISSDPPIHLCDAVSLHAALTQLRDALEEAQGVARRHEVGFSTSGLQELLNDLSVLEQDTVNNVNALETWVHSRPRHAGTVLLDSERAIYCSARQCLESASEKAPSLVETYPTGFWFLSPFSKWIRETLFRHLEDKEVRSNGHILKPQDALIETHVKLIDSILVVSQDLSNVAIPDPPSDSGLPDRFVSQYCGAQSKISRLLRLKTILSGLENLFSALTHASLSVSPFELVVPLCRAAPFVDQVTNLALMYMERLWIWHKSMLKFTYVFANIVESISKDGFCQPSEGDNDVSGGDAEGQADQKTAEGTGIGEGQGAKNVSNEIEGEEQLEGLEDSGHQDDNTPDGNQGSEDKKDAFEMSTDFDGRLDDVSDDGEDQSNDEDVEREDQIGNVDPLGPGAVDEKFWSGEKEEKEGTEGQDRQDAQTNEDARDESNQTGAERGDEQEGQAQGREDAVERDSGEGQKNSKDEQREGSDEQDGNEEGETVRDGIDESDMSIVEEEEPEGTGMGKELPSMEQHANEEDILDLPEDLAMDENGKAPEKDDMDDDLDEFSDEFSAAGEGLSEDDKDGKLPETAEPPSNNPDPNGQNDAKGADGQPSQDLEDPNQNLDSPENRSEPASQFQPRAEPQPRELGKEQTSLGGGAESQNENKADDQAQTGGAVGPQGKKTTKAAQREIQGSGTGSKQEDDEMEDVSVPSEQQQQQGGNNAGDKKHQTSNMHAHDEGRKMAEEIKDWKRRLDDILERRKEGQKPGDDARREVDPSQPNAESEKTNGIEREMEYVGDEEGDADQNMEAALAPATEEQMRERRKVEINQEDQGQIADDEDYSFPIDDDDEESPFSEKQQKIKDTLIQFPRGIGGENGHKNEESGSGRETAEGAVVPPKRTKDPTFDKHDIPNHVRDEEDKQVIDLDATMDIDEEETPEDVSPDFIALQELSIANPGRSQNLWSLYTSLTSPLSHTLTEQLRLVLEPTSATRLKGDYRSGKRLNMKKVIPFIASDFKKDKIWLRRSKPGKREWRVVIALDDSKSMVADLERSQRDEEVAANSTSLIATSDSTVHLAFQSLALIAQSLDRLEVGQVSIVSFGSRVDVLHTLGSGPINEEKGEEILRAFKFSQEGTNVKSLLERSLEEFERDAGKGVRENGEELWGLEIIISDGICQDHESLARLIRRGKEERVVFVFLIMDSLNNNRQGTSSNPSSNVYSNSILSMNSVSYVPNPTLGNGAMELKMESYLDTFPFEYFVVIRDVKSLPEVLSSTIRQFLERVSNV